jgi:VWFA-related protein
VKRWLATLLIGASATAGAALAQTPPRVEFSSAISVVSVPVFVTDRSGRAVSGLTQDDFEITDEGKPMRIVGFREIDASATPDDAIFTESPAARRQFLLLFDLSFSSVAGLVRSRHAAAAFVRTGMTASDLGAVATFSANHGVRLLVGFTSDKAQLRRAIDTLGVLQLDRQADPLGLAYDLRDVGAALSDTLPDESGNTIADTLRAVQMRYERSQEAAYKQRVLALIDGLGQLARALDAVQGRKQVVLLSSGFDDVGLLGQQGPQAVQDSEAIARGRTWEVTTENRFGDAQTRQELTSVLKAFSSSDAVVHSIDVTGLSARGDMRHESAEPARRSGRESLAEIASGSGGRFFKDTNDLGLAFAEIGEMSRHYYLVAFEPGAPRGPGKFHRLRVRLRTRDKGNTVSHRSGYFERSLYADTQPLSRRFQAAEVIAKGVAASELPLLGLAIPYRQGAAGVQVPVVVEVGRAAFAQAQSGLLPVEIYGYAIDPGGALVDLVALVSNLDLAKTGERLRQRGLQVHATFTLRPGPYSLRFLVRESETGRMGSYWLEVTVPELDPAEVQLFPPLFMGDPADLVVLQAHSRSTREPLSPFVVGTEAFVPRPKPTLVNGRAETVCLLAFDGGRRFDPGASFEIKPKLVDHAGQAVALGGRVQIVKSVSDGEGFRRFVLGFTPSDIPAGEYTFRASVRDPGTGRVSEAFQAIRVE